MRLEAAKAGSRNWVLWLSLLATFALVYWQWSAGQEEDASAVSEPAVPTAARPTAIPQEKMQQTAPIADEVPVAKASASQTTTAVVADSGWRQRDLPAGKLSHPLFVAQEWLPPPPKPQPPPPPQAPPVPYTYVGSMEDMPDGHTVILMQQKKVLMPKVGAQVNAQWRLDKEDAQSVYFTYLPLEQAVTLSKAKAAANQRQSMAEAQPEDNIPLEQ